MNKKQTFMLLAAIFFLTLSLRLFFTFQYPSFNDDNSFYSLRQAEHIIEYGYPIIDDPLSYGGRSSISPPLFYYLLSFFGLFAPLSLVGKIIPNLFASLTVFPIYLISKDLTGNNKLALFGSFVSTFIPIFFAQTVNTVNSYSIMIPLILFLLFFFIRINKQKTYQVAFLITLFIALFTHPISAIFIMGLIIFLLFMKLEHMVVRTREIELTIFSTLFLLWLDFLIYKNAFLLYGPAIIWYNIPSTIIANYFSNIDIITAVKVIGIIPFFYGIYIFYKYIFKQKNRNIYLILSYIFALAILLWMKLIPLKLGLMFLGVFLILLICVYLKIFFEYFSKTRFHKLENLFIVGLIFGFITTSFIPTVQYTNEHLLDSYSLSEINAFIWAEKNLDSDSVILASPNEGHLVTYYGNASNVIDSNYLFIDDIDIIFEDVKTIYSTKYETQAIDLLSKYKVSHIYISPRVLRYYDVRLPQYLEDNKCFKRIYYDHESRVSIYESVCRLDN